MQRAPCLPRGESKERDTFRNAGTMRDPLNQRTAACRDQVLFLIPLMPAKSGGGSGDERADEQ